MSDVVDVVEPVTVGRFEVRLYEIGPRSGVDFRQVWASLGLRGGLRCVERIGAHQKLLADIRRDVNAALDEAERRLANPYDDDH